MAQVRGYGLTGEQMTYFRVANESFFPAGIHDVTLTAVFACGQVLAAAGVVKGRRCAAYPAVGPDVVNAGGEYVDIPVDKVNVDGNLVTAPAWPAHPEWLAAFLGVMGTRIEL